MDALGTDTQLMPSIEASFELTYIDLILRPDTHIHSCATQGLPIGLSLARLWSLPPRVYGLRGRQRHGLF